MACTFRKVCVPNSSTGSVLKRYVSTLISRRWTEYPRGNAIQFQVIFHPESRQLGTLAYNAITVRGKSNPACGENVLTTMIDINMNLSRNIFTSSFRMWPAVASHSNSFSQRKSVSELLPGRLTSFSSGQNAMLTPVTSHLIAHPARSIRMKHTKPKVPSSRMNSVYDIEGAITDEEAAKQFVYALNTNERKHLYAELARFHGAPDPSVADPGLEKPTRQQLKQVAMHQMFPFIGFGFLDNFLMIVAGEYIDVTLGVALGISTMAAAALGNLISDVAGLGSAHYVESWAAKVGVKNPHLSPTQVDMGSTKFASNMGKVIGVTIGCLLGMVPLLFFKDKEEKKNSRAETETRESDPLNKMAVGIK